MSAIITNTTVANNIDDQMNNENGTLEWIMSKVDQFPIKLSFIFACAMVLGSVVPYVPQYFQIKQTQNTEGFSLYVCLTLLIANILRIMFWFGKHFETPLLIQSIVMILAMFLLLELCVRCKNSTLIIQQKRRYFSDLKTIELNKKTNNNCKDKLILKRSKSLDDYCHHHNQNKCRMKNSISQPKINQNNNQCDKLLLNNKDNKQTATTTIEINNNEQIKPKLEDQKTSLTQPISQQKLPKQKNISSAGGTKGGGNDVTIGGNKNDMMMIIVDENGETKLLSNDKNNQQQQLKQLLINDEMLIIDNNNKNNDKNDNDNKKRRFIDFDMRYFWEWTDFISYLECMAIFTLLAGSIFYFFIDVPLIVEGYGLVALVTESLLASPQFFRNLRVKSVEGMSKLMVLTWFLGDLFKTIYFFVRQAPFQFLLCGCTQITFDTLIFLQIIYYNKLSKSYRKIPPKSNKLKNLENRARKRFKENIKSKQMFNLLTTMSSNIDSNTNTNSIVTTTIHHPQPLPISLLNQSESMEPISPKDINNGDTNDPIDECKTTTDLIELNGYYENKAAIFDVKYVDDDDDDDDDNDFKVIDLK